MKTLLTLALSFITVIGLQANPIIEPIVEDTLFTELQNDIVILSSTKETNSLRSLPAAVTILSPKRLEALQIKNLKGLSSYIPNYSVADYGSKMTAPIYIRGIGARSGTQTVSMYVDNIPYFNTTSFDTELMDIQRVEVLRGTQSTLYGRNAMGGLLNIYTYSPLDYQGTKIQMGGGSYGELMGSASHYRKLNDNMGVSGSVYYKRNDGYFRNSYDGSKVDNIDNVGGRMKFAWEITPNLTATLNTSFDYVDQGAFPYVNKSTDEIAFKSDAYYKRKLSTNGLALRYSGDGFEINSTTGYQYLHDDMNMDQDYTVKDIFQINQRQNENSLSQEFTIKSVSLSNYQWSGGVFGFYDYLKTTAPVYMMQDGISMLIEDGVNGILGNLPTPMPISLKFNDEEIELGGLYRNKVYGGAIFHQSTYNNLFTDGLSITAGARLDYEKVQLDYLSEAPVNFTLNAGPMKIKHEALAKLAGKTQDDYFEFLPKAVLKYEFDYNTYLYASVARGYKTGGYNVQMFADLLQDELMYAMMGEMKDYPGMGQMVENMLANKDEDIDNRIAFKPEYSMSYEFGGKVDIIKNKLSANFAAYYMDVKDVQVTQFVRSGGGRMVANAGKARSQGFEVGLNSRPCKGVFLYANYGFSDAKFRNYIYKEADEDGEGEIDYSGNYIPFAPRSTFSVGGSVSYDMKKCTFLDKLSLDANFAGKGKIYWDEGNTRSQGFTGEMNARLGFHKDKFLVEAWGENILNRKYDTFTFESMGNYFGQRSKPMRFGGSIKIML